MGQARVGVGPLLVQPWVMLSYHVVGCVDSDTEHSFSRMILGYKNMLYEERLISIV